MGLEGPSRRCSCSFTVSRETCWHDVLGFGHLELSIQIKGISGSYTVKPGIKAGGGGSLALSDPEPGLDVMMTHPGAVGQISTPTTSPGISSPQASLSDQLHWCLLPVQSMESPPHNYVSYFWVPVPQWYYLPSLKVYPYLDKPIVPGWFTGEGKWGESTYWTSFPQSMGGWVIS